MTLVGTWTLYWSWGARNGVFPSTEMTFNADGTFTQPQWNYTGKWTEVAGTVMWQYDPPDPRPIYAGNRAGTAITGLMCSWGVGKGVGTPGTFYAIAEAPTVAEAEAERVTAEYDPAGRPLEQKS